MNCLFVPIALLALSAVGQSQDTLAQLRATEQIVAAVAEQAAPWMVTIETVGSVEPAVPTTRPPEPGLHPPAGPSTGVIVSADGWIITSSYSFVRTPAVVTVRLADGRRFVAQRQAGGRLFAQDSIRMLAAIKIDAQDLPTPEWAQTDAARVGQWVIALGLGHGGARPAVSVGIISALDRHAGLAMQTDALISPANYGGPVLDLNGRVLGISVPMGHSPGELAGVELYDSGVGFCITADQVRYALDRLARGEDIEPGRIGAWMGPADEGLRIIAVADPSPARSADVRVGDIVRHLRRLLRPRAAGEHILLTIQRGDDRLSVPLQLARIADIGPPPELPAEPTTQPTTRGSD
jgi:serine protease Do